MITIREDYLTEEVLEKLLNKVKPYCKQGKLADYIPALAKQNKNDLAVSINANSQLYSAGEFKNKFTIQSISKIITLAIVLEETGSSQLFKRVGMEPTEATFNSITNLEKHKKPINPMVNAGALTVTNMIKGDSVEEKMDKILQKVQELARNSSISYDESVAHSEYETAYINRSLCYLLQEYKLIDGNIDELLQLYTRQCAIEINTVDLANIASVLANHGVDPQSGKRIISKEHTRIINTIMLICGMYNVSGDFAMNVGFPAKSGVSGALIGVVPGVMGIGIYSPSLNEYGNSVAGTKLMELLADRFNLYLL